MVDSYKEGMVDKLGQVEKLVVPPIVASTMEVGEESNMLDMALQLHKDHKVAKCINMIDTYVKSMYNWRRSDWRWLNLHFIFGAITPPLLGSEC